MRGFTFCIAARDEIKSVNALQGRTFAVSRIGSVDHSLSMLALKVARLQPGRVEVGCHGCAVDPCPSTGGRPSRCHVTFGWHLGHDPERSRRRILVDHNTYFENATVIEKVNAVTTKVLDEKPEHLRRFTAAILKASRHFAENQEAWVAAMTKRRPDLDRKDAADLWAGFKTAWAVNGFMNLEAYKKTADFFYQSGTLEKVPRIEVGEWTETRFVDDVLKEIGVNAKFDSPGRTLR